MLKFQTIIGWFIQVQSSIEIYPAMLDADIGIGLGVGILIYSTFEDLMFSKLHNGFGADLLWG